MIEPSSSTSGHEAVATLASSADQLLRPARALIGWLPEDRALLLLNGARADATPTDQQREQAAAARAAVENRASGLDQDDVVRPLPTGLLDAHVDQLRAGAAAPYFAEGFEVALVDLTRVCGFQPSVFTDSATERAGGVDVTDFTQLARVTLPTEWNVEQRASLDEGRHLWMLASRNPNLRIVGQFAGPVGPNGLPGFGFIVTITPSFVQVASYQGRHFLRDGYHRSIGLLALGARFVPALVRPFTSIQELVPAGMLPQEAFMGPKPPLLADFADDGVAATVYLPASQKMVVVQGLELSPHG